MIILAKEFLAPALLSRQQLVAHNGRLAPENIPVGEGLQPRPLSRCEVSMVERMHEVRIECRRNCVAGAIRMHPSVVLVVCSCRDFSIAVSRERLPMLRDIRYGLTRL